ncbi:unnamed protein product [Penicillium olsonii]|nr:unnamed protein product [Penicillium olsonii]
MMRSYLLAGLLTALCNPAQGLVFSDRIKQDFDGKTVQLLHGVEDPTTVQFGPESKAADQAWEFNTEGYDDDTALIRPKDTNHNLICLEGSKCILDLEGKPQPYRVIRVSEDPIFTFQDIESSLYVSRAEDLTLELTPVQDDNIYFRLETTRHDHDEA